MTKNEFSHAFKRGLGGALLHLININNREDYKPIVLWCCLHNTCYDTQSEGNRSKYLYDAIKLFQDKEYFETAIIDKFRMETISDYWLFSQLSNLLYLFAANGCGTAKRALYEKYDFLLHKLAAMRKWQGDYSGASETVCEHLISLDGFEVFKKIITEVGIRIVKAAMPHLFVMDRFYSEAKAKFGTKRVDSYLRKQACKSDGVALFFKEIHRFDLQVREEQPAPNLQEYMCNFVKTTPSKYKNGGYARRFAQIATQEDLLTIASAAILEDELEKKLNLLTVFKFTAFPLDEKYIFGLLENPDETIRDRAFMMLEQMVSPSIRDYSNKLLQDRVEVANALSVLCTNYQEQDEQLLFEIIKEMPITPDGEWHGCFWAIEEVYGKRKFKPKTNILSYIYYNTLCSHCRCNVVKTMYRSKVLPPEILQECLYDSSEETRSFARRRIDRFSL